MVSSVFRLVRSGGATTGQEAPEPPPGRAVAGGGVGVGDVVVCPPGVPLPVASEADDGTGKEEQDQRGERHPESRTEVGVLGDAEAAHVVVDFDVEGDVDRHVDDDDERGEEGHEGGQ